MPYPLTASTWGQEEIDAITRTIASDRFTMGPRVVEFEKKFAEYLGRRYAVMTNSGSSANLIGVAALCYHSSTPLCRGDEVIVPAVSWGTTYHPLQQYGLKLRVVDVELESLNMDVTRLREALTDDTRMIVGVSILGNPAALDVMDEFAARNGLWFFEDNCESMGAELHGRKTGTFGHFSTFSFFFSHHISTIEGGMLVTDDEELYHLTRSLRAHGWTRDLPADASIVDRRQDEFYEAYRFILPGYNVRSTELNAAVGLEQMKKLPAMLSARERNWDYFRECFAQDPKFIIQRETGRSSSFCFTIILDPAFDVDRSTVLDALGKAEIEFRIITGGNFLRHDVKRYYDYEVVGGSTPNADIVHDRGFFVGNHPYDLRSEIDELRSVLDRVV